MTTEQETDTKKWVKFEDESDAPPAYPGVPVETTEVTLHNEEATVSSPTVSTSVAPPSLGFSTPKKPAASAPVVTSPPSTPAVIPSESVSITIPRSKAASPEPSQMAKNNVLAPMKSVALRDHGNGTHLTPVGTNVGNAVIRQGFANGEVIVTLLPVNTQWPWVTPAKFRPELVPEELMAQGLTLTVEDYVHVMELLTNDVRFNLYNVCYKRILVVWIVSAFLVLLGLLFSGVTGLTLFGLGVMWLILNAAAIFLCMWLKIKLNHGLEKCLGQVNKHLIKHKIILGLDDRGKISCHKVNLCFIYFDSTDCIKKLQDVIGREERENGGASVPEAAVARQRTQFQQRMDIDDSDIIIQGANTSRVSRKQARAEMLFLRYSSRWVKLFVRRLLELNVDSLATRSGASWPPRHCATGRCPCQFIDYHLKYKPRGRMPIVPTAPH